MTATITIGIIREGKVPPDARVPLTPDQCHHICQQYPMVRILVQPSPIRSYKDEEYSALGIPVQEDLEEASILLGVKEVPKKDLIPGKTYLFFSHTIKKQPYNRELLQKILELGIKLIDYEVITDESGNRLIAFGYYAGIVGAHNSLWAFGERHNAFSLPRMYQCHDYAAVKSYYQTLQLPALRIVVTGSGRVAAGAVQNLRDMGIRQISPSDFLSNEYKEAVFTQLSASEYVRRKDGQAFEKQAFYQDGSAFESNFGPYMQRADIFINCIYYDPKAPAFFTLEDMQRPDFRIQVIGDVTCDIMPGASVPSTVRPSTILEPLYSFNPATQETGPAHQPGAIDVMAIDNLPSELPRDASAFFGQQLLERVLPELLLINHTGAIERATIAENGQLGPHFQYLQSYVDGK